MRLMGGGGIEHAPAAIRRPDSALCQQATVQLISKGLLKSTNTTVSTQIGIEIPVFYAIYMCTMLHTTSLSSSTFPLSNSDSSLSNSTSPLSASSSLATSTSSSAPRIHL